MRICFSLDSESLVTAIKVSKSHHKSIKNTILQGNTIHPDHNTMHRDEEIIVKSLGLEFKIC